MNGYALVLDTVDGIWHKMNEHSRYNNTEYNVLINAIIRAVFHHKAAIGHFKKAQITTVNANILHARTPAKEAHFCHL